MRGTPLLNIRMPRLSFHSHTQQITMVLGLGNSNATELPLLRVRILEARDLAALTQAPVHQALGSDNLVQQRDGYAGVNPLATVPGAPATGLTTNLSSAPLANTTHAGVGSTSTIPGVSGSEVTAERLAGHSTLAHGVLADGRIKELPDVFVKVSLKGLLKKKFNTATLANTVHPVWNEEFIFEPKHAEKDLLVVKVFDGADTLLGRKLLGQVRVPIFEYLNRGVLDEWRPLLTKNGQPARGDVRIQLAYGTNFPAPLVNEKQSAAGLHAAGVPSNLTPNTAPLL